MVAVLTILTEKKMQYWMSYDSLVHLGRGRAIELS